MPLFFGPLALIAPTIAFRAFQLGYLHGSLLAGATLWSLWYLCTLED